MQPLATVAQNGGSGPPPRICIGIFAWNEERIIGATLGDLFRQSLFEQLIRSGDHCEIICVLNGCTDRTASVAASVFAEQQKGHPARDAISCQVADLTERGKINAWNQFVHALSPRGAEVLFMMDADIGLPRQETLSRMLQALETDPEANVAVDRPRKDIEFKPGKSARDYISLAMSSMTKSAPGQLCGQLYAIRTPVARKIWLPKDLAACEDGFVKAMVCTDLLTQPVSTHRIRQAEDAEHVFEAYTTPRTIFRNQKRQIIGQTIVHILVDQFLNSLPVAERPQMAQLLQRLETDDPAWLKRLIRDHVEKTRYPWQLYPGLLTQRFKHLKRMPLLKRILMLPTAVAAACVAGVASVAALSSLKAGDTKYWPKAPRPTNPPDRSGHSSSTSPSETAPAPAVAKS